MDKNVLIGLCDIASFTDDWRCGFEGNGYRVTSGSVEKQAPIQSSRIDFNIRAVKTRIGYFLPGRISARYKRFRDKAVDTYFLNKAIKEYDIFVFIWSSYCPDHSDLAFLKQHGKKIVTIFCGDDVRWNPARDQEFKAHGLLTLARDNYDYSTNALDGILLNLRTFEKYSDMILSQPNMSALALRPYHNLVLPIIASAYPHNPLQRGIPTIVHAPTSKTKGTEYIEPVIEKLRQEGLQFNYVRIQNIPRNKALKIYAEADIIIDQVINSPGGGKLAHECLASGKVVLSIMASNIYDQQKLKECPIVDVDHLNLYQVLKSLIPDLNRRSEIASKGRPYIEKNHNPSILAERIINHLNGSKMTKPDFFPTFFRNDFIPESEESILVYNKWTETVKNCDWYKNFIQPGSRNGLLF
jgi:hypothetical protein